MLTVNDYTLWTGALHRAVEGGFGEWYYSLSREDRDRFWQLHGFVADEMLKIVDDDPHELNDAVEERLP